MLLNDQTGNDRFYLVDTKVSSSDFYSEGADKSIKIIPRLKGKKLLVNKHFRL